MKNSTLTVKSIKRYYCSNFPANFAACRH